MRKEYRYNKISVPSTRVPTDVRVAITLNILPPTIVKIEGALGKLIDIFFKNSEGIKFGFFLKPITYVKRPVIGPVFKVGLQLNEVCLHA